MTDDAIVESNISSNDYPTTNITRNSCNEVSDIVIMSTSMLVDVNNVPDNSCFNNTATTTMMTVESTTSSSDVDANISITTVSSATSVVSTVDESTLLPHNQHSKPQFDRLHSFLIVLWLIVWIVVTYFDFRIGIVSVIIALLLGFFQRVCIFIIQACKTSTRLMKTNENNDVAAVSTSLVNSTAANSESCNGIQQQQQS